MCQIKKRKVGRSCKSWPPTCSALTCRPPRWSSCRGCARWWTRWWRPAPRSPGSRASRAVCTKQRTPGIFFRYIFHPMYSQDFFSPARLGNRAEAQSRNGRGQGWLSGRRTSSGAERCGTHLSGRGRSASCSWCSLVSCHSVRSAPPCHSGEREESGDLVCPQYHRYCPREWEGPPETFVSVRSHFFSFIKSFSP